MLYVPLIAHVMSSFILALVETLVAKTRAWEENRGLSFMYDGVPLLAMLDEYVMLRQEREEEKKRMRVSVICSLITWMPIHLIVHYVLFGCMLESDHFSGY